MKKRKVRNESFPSSFLIQVITFQKLEKALCAQHLTIFGENVNSRTQYTYIYIHKQKKRDAFHKFWCLQCRKRREKMKAKKHNITN